MTDVVIRVENVSKEYRLGVIGHGTLSKDLQSRWARFRGTEDPNAKIDYTTSGPDTNERFWALKDVSFDVHRGEVVGIIGRNGAGKSTLLKILSRVTTPTTGTVKVKGRIASLLEVGTGFHPELTGRENVFLNGAILGMTRREVEEKFDEIVGFAEIEKFIDTPVKRYSSGMYVRLAFAVAAHLEPEILIVDEVLAVGDASFQKKCLGKMGEVAKEGRTVLFVSHNMGAIRRLCKKSILLSSGRIEADGITSDIIDRYLTSDLLKLGEKRWDNPKEAPGNDVVRLLAVRSMNKQKTVSTTFSVREPIYLEIEYHVMKQGHLLDTGFYLYNSSGDLIFTVSDLQNEIISDKGRHMGVYKSCCEIPGDLMNAGLIRVMVAIVTNPSVVHCIEHDVLKIEILDNFEGGGARGSYIREWPGAAVRPLLKWTVTYNDEILT